MASNTKLDKFEKDTLKAMKLDYPEVCFATDYVNLVCAFYPVGTNVRFAFAIASKDETKFRRKVGEYLAMQRVLPDWDNTYTMLPYHDFHGMLDALEVVTY